MRPIDTLGPVSAGFTGNGESHEIAAVTNGSQMIRDENVGTAPQGDISPAAGSSSSQISDPLLASLARASLSNGAAPAPARQPWENPAAGDNILYTKPAVNGTAAAPAPAQSTPITVPDDVAEVLTEGAGTKNRNAAQSFARAQQALAAGDYSKAHDALEKLMRGDGEDVLDPDQLQATENVRDQLGFLSDMQKAGIRADYPPTEAQLVSYFKTLKNNPAAARQAFESYAQSFHVHPANVRGADSDIRYSNVKVKQGDAEYITDAPQSWSDVSKRPARGYQYASRQMNDCQGYAYIAQDLLGAAGFKLVHHIAASTGENSGHAMAVFTHPKEKGYTLTSDDDTFQGTNEKELAKQAYKKLNVKDESGHERFFVGKTEADAEINLAAKKHEL